eukprot:3115147-Prymnesium_polylepis.1
MINTGACALCGGGWQDTHWPDCWTAVTKDGLPSAQFEHTMVVTENGIENLTARCTAAALRVRPVPG